MSAGGDLVPRPALRGEVLPPLSPAPAGGGGSVFSDFANRLSGYVTPPPPAEAGWQAVAGVGMAIGGAGLVELLPAGRSIMHAGLFKWVGRSGLASTMDSVGALVGPFALVALVALIGIAVIYLTGWGAPPALVFLTAQTWVGVAVLAVAVLAWVYLLILFVINLVIWAVVIALVVAAGFALLMIIGMAAGGQ